MAMHTEPGLLRLPAWLTVSLAGVGVILGLWQVGVFDRPTAPERGVYGDGVVGHASMRRGNRVGIALPPDPNQSVAGADGPVTAVPATHFEQLVSHADPQVQAESAALLEALTAEQASDP